jgi:hypothetical protein
MRRVGLQKLPHFQPEWGSLSCVATAASHNASTQSGIELVEFPLISVLGSLIDKADAPLPA